MPATLGPQRLAYVPTLVGGTQPRVLAVDTTSGAIEYRLDATDIGGSVPGSASLVDENGSYYFASADAVSRFDSQGQRQWQTPVAGLARGLQFTADRERIVLFSWNGWGYVLDAQTGEVLFGENLWPTASFAP
jgi:outer membrane protein assembly factor BamB